MRIMTRQLRGSTGSLWGQCDLRGVFQKKVRISSAFTVSGESGWHLAGRGPGKSDVLQFAGYDSTMRSCLASHTPF